MELVLAGSPAAKAGFTADVIRAKGLVRVAEPVGSAVAKDSMFAFSNSALGAAGLHPVAKYTGPANPPSSASPYPLRLLTLKRHYSIDS